MEDVYKVVGESLAFDKLGPLVVVEGPEGIARTEAVQIFACEGAELRVASENEGVVEEGSHLR